MKSGRQGAVARQNGDCCCSIQCYVTHSRKYFYYLPAKQLDNNRQNTEVGLKYYTQGDIHKIKIFDEFSPKVTVTVKSWRLMRKHEKPHDLHLNIHENDQKIRVVLYMQSWVSYMYFFPRKKKNILVIIL